MGWIHNRQYYGSKALIALHSVYTDIAFAIKAALQH